jgi:hypothetical protein
MAIKLLILDPFPELREGKEIKVEIAVLNSPRQEGKHPALWIIPRCCINEKNKPARDFAAAGETQSEALSIGASR